MRVPPPATNWRDFIKRRHKLLSWGKKPEKYFNNKVPPDRRCAICETYEWVKPIPVTICDKCLPKLNREHGASFNRKFAMTTVTVCFFCRKRIFRYWEVGIKACNRCLLKISKWVNEANVKEKKIEKKQRE